MAEISSVQMKLSAYMIDHFANHSINWVNTVYAAESVGQEGGQRDSVVGEKGCNGSKSRGLGVIKEEESSGSE